MNSNIFFALSVQAWPLTSSDACLAILPDKSIFLRIILMPAANALGLSGSTKKALSLFSTSLNDGKSEATIGLFEAIYSNIFIGEVYSFDVSDFSVPVKTKQSAALRK